MAKAGTKSRVSEGAKAAAVPGATRHVLVDAAIETLRDEGFTGASARAIARRAGCNQALVFYHFGSVANLLVAALDETSRRRMDAYRDMAASADGLSALVEAAAAIFRQDLDAGHMTVLAELMAGASSTPGLGPEVSARIAPWIDFTEEAVRGALGDSALSGLVPAGEVAYAVVALYLGMELLSHLDGDRTRADGLFTAAGHLAGLLAPLMSAGGAPSSSPGCKDET